MKPGRRFIDITTAVTDNMNTKYGGDQYGEMFKLQSFVGNFARKATFDDKFIRAEIACRKEGRPMRKPGEKGAPTKQDFKNARGESVEINENEGLKNKAEKSGMPLGILKQVYNRGIAAWKTGHRPGTTPQQWGMARVNSYITKGKGTYYGADADLSGKGKKK